jgi:hypothetical protein
LEQPKVITLTFGFFMGVILVTNFVFMMCISKRCW